MTSPDKVVLIERTPLLDRIQENLGRRLTLIDAPAGYGKTTLLDQLRARLSGCGFARAWVQIERRHGDPTSLVALLEQAARADLGIHATVSGDLAPLVRLSMLTSIMGENGVEACLIIDDAHFAHNDACLELFEYLIHNSPRTLHIVIATRERSGIPVSGLRLQGEVHEITVNDLRFDEGDIGALFAQPLDEQVSRQLIERTEGWPVAVQLTQLTHDCSVPLAHHVNGLSGSRAELADYLNERVFQQLPEELQQFLLETAHLERLNGDLADAVRARSDGWARLLEVWTAGILLSRSGAPEDGWFKHHQLFLEFLRQQQIYLGREHVYTLHRRAADWFFDTNDLQSAIHHAKAGKDYARAIGYIENFGGVLVGIRQGVGYLRSLLGQIPTNLVHESPRAKLCSAYVLAKEGRIVEANRLFDEVVAQGVSDDRNLADEITLIGALLRIYEDRTISDEDIARFEDLTRSTPESEPLVRGVLYNILCVTQIQAGDLKSARLSGERAMAYYRDLDAKYLQFFIHINISIIDLEEGLLSDAQKRRTTALNLAERYFPADRGLAGIASVLLSEVHLERGDPMAASRHIFNSLHDIEVREGWSELYVPGYTVAMEVAYANNGLEAAAEVLDQAERTIRRRNMRRLQRLICYKRLDLFVRADRADLAELTLQDIDRLTHAGAEDAGPCWRGYYMAAFSLARYHIRFGNAAHALELLSDAVCESQEANAVRFRVKGLVLQSMALHEAGNSRAAAKPFKQAIALGSSCGFYGSFTEEGRLFAQSVQAIVRTTGIGDMSDVEVEFVARLLSDMCAGDRGEAAHILSSRELEVMEQLAQGHSNKRIARHLGLSEPTVKFHLKNIYAKLGVNKRALAVSVARRHGLDKPPEVQHL
ncbi:MAG: LuxR C-terminal-related transcriptional regulator [Rhodospirillales bacterium]|nr:LuxR C-terminal-related transcriptional regulator [Rhodospirillales bacterium]